ncbi:MAG: S9 family peptidase [Bacteroidota bacterium]|jgi:dipeptidyl aminopeptidase/acylaminoacyl peptidase
MRRIAILCAVLIPFVFVFAQTKHPITFDDFISLGRVTDPQVSPDGSTVAFVVTYHNKIENKTNSNIYLVPVDGGAARQLTNAKGANNSPRWMPDGKSLAFISSRGGEAQIWIVPATGGESRKVSTISTGVSDLQVSPDGKWFSFSSTVYPECPNDDCNKKRTEEVEKSKVKAKIFDRLPYRVWNEWKDGKRNHLFVMPATGGVAADITPGDFDSPPIDLGGNSSYSWSPDSKEIAFERNTDPVVAIGTNNDIFVVPVTGGEARKITDNPGNDSQPLYSPDGKYIAYLQMKRAGFEADQKHLILYDRSTGKRTNLSEQFDYSLNEVLWSPDSKAIYFNADATSNESVFKLTVEGKKISSIIGRGYNHDLRMVPGGLNLVVSRESINQPVELYRIGADGKTFKKITTFNDSKVDKLDMNPKEDFWFDGAGGTKVHGFLVMPPAFDASKKYPMIFLIHGGPQGQWGDQFHYRWSAQMFASRGYVAVLINPRGSTGYGQHFTDEISRDWGGKPYEDLMLGLDYVLKTYPFIDAKRMAAAGASYGGYMINWIEGHTDRFRCLVSHDGVFNPKSMYGTTEELWFPEWELGGTPYKNPELYDKWSPMAFVNQFKTPMLVVHGQMDFRLDVSEGFQLFTALQRQGIKSKMLYFPDEGHFVAKPANAELWYKTVLDWIDENTK